MKSCVINSLHSDLQQISQVGDKIASFYLRNIVKFFNVDTKYYSNNIDKVLPIDIWIKRVILKLLNPDLKDAEIQKRIEEESDKLIKSKMIEICQTHHLDAVCFNQGCWVMGFHSFDLVVNYIQDFKIK